MDKELELVNGQRLDNHQIHPELHDLKGMNYLIRIVERNELYYIEISILEKYTTNNFLFLGKSILSPNINFQKGLIPRTKKIARR